MRVGIPQWQIPKCKTMREEGASDEEIASAMSTTPEVVAAVLDGSDPPKRRGRPPKNADNDED